MNKQIILSIVVAISTLWYCRNPETPGSLTFREGNSGPNGPDTTPPVIGTQITFASVADTTLTVNWGPASDIATPTEDLQYKLVKANSAAEIDTVAEIDAIPAGPDLLQNYTNNDTTQNVSGLTPAATYFFAVVVRDASGNKALYAPMSQTMAAPDTTPPATGTAISFASVADTSMTVNWGAATDAVTAQSGLQYRLVKAPSSAAIDTIAEVDAISGGDLLQDYTANDMTQNVAGLASSTTYFFAVVVRDVAGNKAIYAPQSQATTATPDTTAPVSGAAISFASVTNTTLTVNWGVAIDVVTPQAALEYRLVKATTAAAIDTVAEVDAISGADLLQNYTANDVTQNVTGLVEGSTWFYAVVVRDVAGNKALYAPASQAMTSTPPTVGAAISFASVTETSITVNWGAATDATTPQANLQYKLVKAATSTAIDTIAEIDAISGVNLLQDYTANDITENVTGLTAGTTYFFAVVVRDAVGNKTIYTPASQTTADSTAPVAGTAISFASVTGTTMTVNWGAATDAVTPQATLQYRLVKATTAAAIDTIAEVDAISGGDLLQNYSTNDLTQNVTGLSGSTTYYFAVVVRDTTGNKTIYPVGNQMTLDINSPTLGTAISFSNVLETSLTVNWGAATDTVTAQAALEYRLVQATSSAAIDTIAEVDAISGAGLLQDYSPNDVSQFVTGLTVATTYYFSVVVRDAAGNKAIYTPAGQTMPDMTPPTIGTAISFASVTPTTMTVNWGVATDTITAQPSLQYRLVKSTTLEAIDTIAEVDAISGGDLLQTYTANDLTQAVTGLAPLTTYYFAVVVRDAAGNRALYTPASQTTPEAPPTLISSTPANNAMNVPVCSGNPCRAKIILQFSKTMNTGLTQNLTTGTWDGSTYPAAGNAGTTFTWSTTTYTDDTLTITLSWYWFPENTKIRYSIAAADLQSLSGIQIASAVTQYFTTGNAGQSFPIADTGQTNCYDHLTTQTCPYSAYPGQDSAFTNVPNARQFTGPTQHATYTNDYTTLDNLTGLVWRSCIQGRSGPTCSTGTTTTSNWSNALNNCNTLNEANGGLGYAGLTTWRLPTFAELETLPNYGSFGPAIDIANFPVPGNGEYWTASKNYGGTNLAKTVLLSDGSANSQLITGSSYYIRCVASPNTITTEAYTDNGDGTITDQRTNLRWQKCSAGKNNDATCSGSAAASMWLSALEYCDTLSLGSFGNSNNWRLPSVNELKSIVSLSADNPTINGTYFPSTIANSYYTSTTRHATPASAWIVFFSVGAVSTNSKLNNHYIRCVTDGP